MAPNRDKESTPSRRVPLGVGWDLLFLALLVGFILTGCSRSPSVSSPERNSASKDGGWFENSTAKAGIEFVHAVETSGKYLFSEAMGSGGAVLDFDNDGRMDIYLIHNSPSATNQLFQQQADGRFKNVSHGSGLDVSGYGNGLAVGDANNDGFVDVLLTEYNRIRLFINDRGGRFADRTHEAGLTNQYWSVPAAFLDYDRDGWLDLVVGNYLDFDPAQKCFDARGQPDFCGPHGFHSTITRLYRNRGWTNRVAFEDVSVSSGISLSPGKAMQILCADFDGDRWMDIFITDDGLPNRLFVNQRNGKFKEEAIQRGLAYTGMGTAAANMGIAVGDINSDGFFDVFTPHLAEENHTLWAQKPRGLFQDITARAGLLASPWHGTGFGAVLTDIDCDGAVDLVIANGGVRRRPARPVAQPAAGLPAFWAPYAEPPQLFANDGKGRFTEVSANNREFTATASVGRGLVCADIDNDGGPDLLLTSIASPCQYFRNTGRKGHWLGVRATLPKAGNRDAYGAEIEVRIGERFWWGLVQPAYSYASSNDPRVHFGLGEYRQIDSIRVQWPDGAEEMFPGGEVDRYVVVRRGEGTTRGQ